MPSAAILAGGRATRFGGRPKAGIVVDGRSILERQVEELSLVTDDLMFIGGYPPPLQRVRVVPDRVAGCGPLGGLDAALAAARDNVVAVVACDMPYVTASFIEALLDRLEGADIVVPRTSQGLHPLCAVYTRACQGAITRRLAGRQLAVAGLFDDVRVRVVDDHDLPGYDFERQLANVNTPGDLDAIAALSRKQAHTRDRHLGHNA
jgi:molybdopterin-guanine dinucleotide biosynthesis protein A